MADMVLLWQMCELSVTSHTAEWLTYQRPSTRHETQPVHTLYILNAAEVTDAFGCATVPSVVNPTELLATILHIRIRLSVVIVSPTQPPL